MILQALYDYYQRKEGLAPTGLEWVEIPYIIIIENDGKFIRIEDTRENNIGKEFLVVKSKGRTANVVPNIFWDKVEYTLGFGKENLELKKKNSELENSPNDSERSKLVKDIASLNLKVLKNSKKNKAFIELIEFYSEKYPSNAEFHALKLFYKNYMEEVFNDPLWNEIAQKPIVNLSFKINGSASIIAENENLTKDEKTDTKTTQRENQICLITGKKSAVVTTGTAIIEKAKLVSFQTDSGFDSYNKKQGANAPISNEAEAAYSTALITLLSKESRNKVVIGKHFFVFWTISKDNIPSQESFESVFSEIFQTDNPDTNVESVKDMLLSFKTGKLHKAGDDKFYVLGLTNPNPGRIAIQLWQQGTVLDFATNIVQHFDDLEIINNNNSTISLINLLLSVTLKYKRDNIQPNLPEAVMKSILTGSSYPISFYQACIRRIMAEQTITPVRASILKACLNRRMKYNNFNNEKEITMALDKENLNEGYLCGRLFAVLEYIQEKAMGKSNLKERFLNAASTSPVTVFSRILNLSVYHIGKIEKKGLSIYLEKLKGEIINNMNSNGIPNRLTLDDQSRFMLGYYHQNQALYTKRENEDEIETVK
jgi:CRISPR-associated protein Csd1